LGWSGKVWFNRWKCISAAYTTIIVLMFVAVVVAFAAGYRPADFNEANTEQTCLEHKACSMLPNCPMQKGCAHHSDCPNGHEGCGHMMGE
jgi:hypothetical protein